MITDIIRETKDVQNGLSKTEKEKSLCLEVVIRFITAMMVFCAFIYFLLYCIIIIQYL